MKKGLTELVFIIDRSGSMSGLEADTIGGFNGLLEKQKKKLGRHMFPSFFLMIRQKFFMTAWIFRK